MPLPALLLLPLPRRKVGCLHQSTQLRCASRACNRTITARSSFRTHILPFASRAPPSSHQSSHRCTQSRGPRRRFCDGEGSGNQYGTDGGWKYDCSRRSGGGRVKRATLHLRYRCTKSTYPRQDASNQDIEENKEPKSHEGVQRRVAILIFHLDPPHLAAEVSTVARAEAHCSPAMRWRRG